ncbi:hypothetical protein ANRL4_04978 [Anaerolineae bacterium]|nr:hypothetical protein ANRL4_04978 [Anaerolineae bacterium]
MASESVLKAPLNLILSSAYFIVSEISTISAILRIDFTTNSYRSNFPENWQQQSLKASQNSTGTGLGSIFLP